MCGQSQHLALLTLYQSPLCFVSVCCLCKLSQDLLKKCTTRNVQEGNQEIPELKQLLDCLGSVDSLESQLSGQVILHLVETDVLDLTLALNSTLNSVPSCKNLIGAVETVFCLLLLESKAVLASETVYRCPYTLSVLHYERNDKRS
ncbi:focadhesin [Biomphalaria pfeifferi]|uniref:Focadhesin n=1 Tax=Biomphalaria pfeifferi TaxID=112525 RepID=A0AAD8BHM4_BIOPF|nr:focadhesin [Biomphalaria pfeifferi]